MGDTTFMNEKIFKIKIKDMADNPADFTIKTIEPYVKDCLLDVDIEVVSMEEVQE